MNTSYNAFNLTNNNISEIQDLSINKEPSIRESNNTSNNYSLIGSRVTHHFTIILIGDIFVGKTCLISLFCENKTLRDYNCTVTVKSKNKRIHLDAVNTVDLEIFDTCGEEKFKALTRMYYRNAQGVIVVFDLTDETSFQSLDGWLDDVKVNAQKDIEIIIAGNKEDLIDKRVIPRELAQKFAEKRNLRYLEISALTGFNVDLIFKLLIRKLIMNQQMKEDLEKLKTQQSVFNKKEVIKQKLKDKEKDNCREEGCC